MGDTDLESDPDPDPDLDADLSPRPTIPLVEGERGKGSLRTSVERRIMGLGGDAATEAGAASLEYEGRLGVEGEGGSRLLLVPVFLEDEARRRVVGEGGA